MWNHTTIRINLQLEDNIKAEESNKKQSLNTQYEKV